MKWKGINPSEHEIQATIIDFRNRSRTIMPEIRWLHAIPNGSKFPYFKTEDGTRVSPQAMKMIKEGLTPGVVDLSWPLPRGGYHGLYFEIKNRTNKPSPEQIQFMDYVSAQGYYVALFRDAQAAIEELKRYYQGKIIKMEGI